MSRCFPFPPPGYEKKAKIDDSDLLKKEKHKEKKRKKEEKDKQKGEGKERRDKEKSKEKHREKKDRKEKHNDNKDRDKDKGKIRIPDEKKTNGTQPEFYNGGKLGPNNLHTAGTSQDSEFVLELDRRIRGGDKAMGSQMVQKIVVRDQRTCELPRKAAESISAGGAGDKEKVNSQMAQKIMVRDQRTCELPKRVVESIPAGGASDKEKVNNKREDDKKVNGQRIKDEEEGPKNSIIQKHSTGSRRVEGTAKPTETNNVEQQMLGKEKIVLKEKAIRGDKHKEKDGEEKSKSKDKNSGKLKEEKSKLKEEKAKRKEEKAKRKEEKAKKKEEKARKKEEKAKKVNEFNQQQRKLEATSQDSIVACSNKQFHLLKENKDTIAGKIPIKRKEPDTNGVLHVDDIRPSKFPRTVSISNLAVENGRKQELCQPAIKLQPNCQKVESTVDIKEKRINGLIKAPQTVISSTRPPPAPTLGDANGNTSRKPPHPDSKYLDEILSVPKMEVSDFDDQEWLFGSDNHQSKMAKEVSENDGMPEVWAEALRIESSDIIALPYVIPY